jgi:hypothetical protein
MKTSLSDLEKQAEIGWIPQVGDIYYWRESSTRHGNIFRNVVISYDPVKKIVHGRETSGFGERRYLCDVFHISGERKT